MIARVIAIALNTYREAVRARLLLGLFAIALATCGYSLIVASLSLHNELRVIADLGAASIALYGVVVAIVLGSTSLHRELEYKTIFPILSRPLRRWEYIVGKYLGTILTVCVFVSIDAAALFTLLALEAGQTPWKLGAMALFMLAVLGVLGLRARHTRVYVVIPWSAVLALVTWLVASPAAHERQLVSASAVLALGEVAIVAAIATFFSSFSSPFLTATFTGMIFVIGRSADTLAHLPKKLFGQTIVASGHAMARVLPNLHVYVPPRSLLLGEVATAPVWSYVAAAMVHAIFYVTALLVGSALAFSRRDFS